MWHLRHRAPEAAPAEGPLRRRAQGQLGLRRRVLRARVDERQDTLQVGLISRYSMNWQCYGAAVRYLTWRLKEWMLQRTHAVKTVLAY